MSIVVSIVALLAAADLSGNSAPSQDRLAVAAAIEVLELNKLTVLTAHKDANLFWDDFGDKVSIYLNRLAHLSTSSRRNCVAKNIEVVPPEQVNEASIPVELRGQGLREVAMVIQCAKGSPIQARVAYRGEVLARLNYIVEPDNG